MAIPKELKIKIAGGTVYLQKKIDEKWEKVNYKTKLDSETTKKVLAFVDRYNAKPNYVILVSIERMISSTKTETVEIEEHAPGHEINKKVDKKGVITKKTTKITTKPKTEKVRYNKNKPEQDVTEETPEDEVAELEVETEERETIKEEIEEVVGVKGLIIKGDNAYLEGFDKEPMPTMLFEAIKNRADMRSSLMNFWYLCSLNPDPAARNDLFKFVEHNGLHITPSGLIVCFRRVIFKKSGSIAKSVQDENQYIGAAWFDAKKKRKSPDGFDVYKLKGGNFVHQEKGLPIPENSVYLGNLNDLYKNLVVQVEEQFTDAHTKTFTISLCESVRMNRSDCDSSTTNECSRGLHIGSIHFVGTNYDFGNTQLACLVNPMNVVAVPYRNGHKMRVCEYYPFTIVTDKVRDELAKESLAVFEHSYNSEFIDKLLYAVKKQDAVRIKALTAMSDTNYSHLDKFDLSQLNHIVNSRVVKLG